MTHIHDSETLHRAVRAATVVVRLTFGLTQCAVCGLTGLAILLLLVLPSAVLGGPTDLPYPAWLLIIVAITQLTASSRGLSDAIRATERVLAALNVRVGALLRAGN
jgi:hypothetical protein